LSLCADAKAKAAADTKVTDKKIEAESLAYGKSGYFGASSADADALVKVDGYKKDAKIDTEVGVGVGVGGVRGLARQDWCWCRLMLALAPALLARLLEALLTFCVLATLLLLCRLRWRPRDVSGQAGWACDRA
jgi:hypothetical protein